PRPTISTLFPYTTLFRSHRQQREDQHLGGHAHLVGVEHQRQHGEEHGDDRAPGERGTLRRHDFDEGRRNVARRGRHAAFPNRPSGRNARIAAIGPKITKYASSGNITCPTVLSSPTSSEPTAAPTRLP